jgi:MYXO-CTERM domain-containing protein
MIATTRQVATDISSLSENPLDQRTISDTRTNLPLAAILLLVPPACAGDTPDPISECMGTTGEGCQEGEDVPVNPECAAPAFDTSPPVTPSQYVCEGSAGGAIVYNAQPFEVFGVMKGGPNDIQTDPAVTEFPSMGNDVSSCCYGLDPEQEPSDEETITDECRNDCARAACNRVLDQLRSAVIESDPSDGDCAGAAIVAPNTGGEDGCIERLRGSLETWIAAIEAGYSQCVTAAFNNTNPNAPFTDHMAPFGADKKLELPDSGCDHTAPGCLFGAELRPFCALTDFTEAQSCMAAGNDKDANADGALDDTDEGGGGGMTDPFGDLQELIWCSPQTTCTIDAELLTNVDTNFYVFWDEGVTGELGTWATGVTGFKITGLDTGEDSKALLDAFDIRNNDVITHVNSTALVTWRHLADVVADIQNVSSWSITVRREGTPPNPWVTLNYTVSIAVSFGNEVRGDATPAEVAADVDKARSDGSQSCACRASNDRNPRSVILLLLFTAVARRRRRR